MLIRTRPRRVWTPRRGPELSAYYTIGGLLVVGPGGGIFANTGGVAIAPDFFVSPTGDDNNSGTSVGSPWSITALNNSTKRTAYAGKIIGFLPGTYQYGVVGGVQSSLYSLFSTTSMTVGVQGGTSGSPTRCIAVNSAGTMTSPPAVGTGCSVILDSSQPGSGGTVVPNAGTTLNGSGIIGQSQSGTTATSVQGYVTFYGIYVRYFCYTGIGFLVPTSPAINGITIDSCELSDGNNITSSNNPGAIGMYQFPQGCRITNTKIHDLTTISGGGNVPWGHAAVMVNQGTSPQGGCTGRVDHCSFYRVGQGMTTKNNYNNFQVDHCYLEFANMGIYSGTAFPSAIFGQTMAPGDSVSYTWNVVVGGIVNHPEGGGSFAANQGLISASNNTLYCGPGGNSSTAAQYAYSFNNQGATGSGNFDHNLVWLASGYNTSQDPYGTIGYNALGGGWASDYNYYGTGCTFGAPGKVDVNLASWQTLGYDAHSSTIPSTPFVTTPSSNNTSSFIVTSSWLLSSDGQRCGALDANGFTNEGIPPGANF